MFSLKICHLYPDLLNLYGDRGNIITLCKRCEWRGIETSVTPVSIGDPFDGEAYDIVFIGGGQDYEQEVLQADLLGQKSEEIKCYIHAGRTLLAICGGYQLLGRSYITADGHELSYIGALDLWTESGSRRMIGNMAFECDLIKSETCDGVVVGFENHSGRTFLGPGVRPLGRVLSGNGNNGDDHMEGAVFKNTVCSYSHGSLLPKNPRLADHLIAAALRVKYPDFGSLSLLSDELEMTAHGAALKICGL